MKTIWTVIGVIVLIAIIVVFYKMATKPKNVVAMMPTESSTPKNLSGATTQRTETVTEKQTIIVPVVVRNPADCNQAYQDNVLALYDTYRQKRVIYENGIKNNDPNVIQYHKEMNTAYQAYYDQASKCNFFVR